MAKKRKARTSPAPDILARRTPEEKARATKSIVHVLGQGIRCDTENRGHATPGDVDRARLVIDAPGGIIPLWEPQSTLRWRFDKASLESYVNPSAVEALIEEIMSKALLAWGDAVPVKFTKHESNYDFQIVVRERDDCDINGCVLASAFFPDEGRHDLVIYPQMFAQSEEERIETMCHELGHIFGLRHFFAQVSESVFPSELFGVHNRFTIMNYGPDSRMTDMDRADLARLYDEVWSGERTEINGTPIRLVRPFSSLAATKLALPRLLAPAPIVTQPQGALNLALRQSVNGPLSTRSR